jgi:hypothetical protein
MFYNKNLSNLTLKIQLLYFSIFRMASCGKIVQKNFESQSSASPSIPSLITYIFQAPFASQSSASPSAPPLSPSTPPLIPFAPQSPSAPQSSSASQSPSTPPLTPSAPPLTSLALLQEINNFILQEVTLPNIPRSHEQDTPRSHEPDTPRSHEPDTPRSHEPDTPRSHEPYGSRSHEPDTPRQIKIILLQILYGVYYIMLLFSIVFFIYIISTNKMTKACTNCGLCKKNTTEIDNFCNSKYITTSFDGIETRNHIISKYTNIYDFCPNSMLTKHVIIVYIYWFDITILIISIVNLIPIITKKYIIYSMIIYTIIHSVYLLFNITIITSTCLNFKINNYVITYYILFSIRYLYTIIIGLVILGKNYSCFSSDN